MWRNEDLAAIPSSPGSDPTCSTRRWTPLRWSAPAQPRRAALDALLLDQGFLAGMGNYLRAETLFEAGIAPGRRPVDLDDDARAKLARALLDVPRRSYRTRGIAPARGMRRDYLVADGEGFRFHVFDREGQPCHRCGTPIVRTASAGRRMYACPGCQR